jgi:hypothetical protein
MEPRPKRSTAVKIVVVAASGNPTLGKVSGNVLSGAKSPLFVKERALSVRGVVKTVFEGVFLLYHEQNKVKPEFVVISKSPLFAAETAENMFYNLVILNMFYNLVILFFVRKKRRGNYRRTNRSRSAAFLLSRGRVLRGREFYAYSYEIWRGIILCVLVKLWREIL